MFQSFMKIFKICLPNKKNEENVYSLEEKKESNEEIHCQPLLENESCDANTNQNDNKEEKDPYSKLENLENKEEISIEEENCKLSDYSKYQDTKNNLVALKLTNTIFNSDLNTDKETEGKVLQGSTLFPFKQAFQDILSLNMKSHNIVILDSEIENSKKLEIKDIEGDLFYGSTLHIDASGLVNGLRKMRDGHSFFGTIDKIDNDIINDYVLNYKHENSNKKIIFHLYFDRLKQAYFFRNINSQNDKNSIYCKILEKYKILKKEFFMIGEVFMKIEVNDKNELIIHIKNKEKNTCIFTPEDSPVIVGRTKSSINIDSNNISKKHYTIEFNIEDKIWELTDGNNGKKSTNGTWLWISSKIEINHDTYIKMGSNIFMIKLY